MRYCDEIICWRICIDHDITVVARAAAAVAVAAVVLIHERSLREQPLHAHTYIHNCVCAGDSRLDLCWLATSPALITFSYELVFTLHCFVLLSTAAGVYYALPHMGWYSQACAAHHAKDVVPPKLAFHLIQRRTLLLHAACWLVLSSLHLLIHAVVSADVVSERVELLQNVLLVYDLLHVMFSQATATLHRKLQDDNKLKSVHSHVLQ
jgi:hypothetical protein